MPTETKPTLTADEKHACTLLKKVVDLDTKRTAALKAFAKYVCEVRRKMDDAAGTSQAYKDFMAHVYASVNIPPDSESTIQASVRYHIGNELRNEFTPEELQAVGLSNKTPLERAREARTGGTTNQTQSEADHKAEKAETPKAPEVEVIQAPNPPITAASPVKNERRDYRERPRPNIVTKPDPIVLVGHALDSLRSAASLPEIPATEVPTLRDMVNRMHKEIERLEARLAQTKTPVRSTRSRKAAA